MLIDSFPELQRCRYKLRIFLSLGLAGHMFFQHFMVHRLTHNGVLRGGLQTNVPPIAVLMTLRPYSGQPEHRGQSEHRGRIITNRNAFWPFAPIRTLTMAVQVPD